jgi:molybdopterin-binding protein
LLQARHFADKIFFLKDGEILQTGTIKEVFETPSSLDIAEFSVSENIIFGEISKEGSETYLLTKSGLKLHIISNLISGNVAAIIRPEEILISKTPVLSSARNLFKGKIKKIEDAGGIYKVSVECYGLLLNSYITKHSAISMNLKLDSEVYLIFKATSIHILPLT